MSNTKRTNGPTPHIVRMGHTTGPAFGADVNAKGSGDVAAKPRDLKP